MAFEAYNDSPKPCFPGFANFLFHYLDSPDSDDEDTLSSSRTLEDSEATLENSTDDEAQRHPNEWTGLLAPPDVEDGTRANGHERYHERHHSVTAITFFPTKPKFTTVKRRPYYIPRPRWSSLNARTKWWLLFFYDFLNAPLLGAVLGAIIGLITPLHKAFFAGTYQGGIFTAWLTESWKNLGQLFVPLPLVVAGISLYTSYIESRKPTSSGQETRVPVLTTAFILFVRFVVWPVLSIAVIYAIAKGGNGILGDDPVLWFTMMLMPTGPPAMKLITMIQVSDAGVEDEQKIAKILTISYIVSPVLAFTVVGALRASQSIM